MDKSELLSWVFVFWLFIANIYLFITSLYNVLFGYNDNVLLRIISAFVVVGQVFIIIMMVFMIRESSETEFEGNSGC